jgi:tripartite-type tricarboxylate transporter receptor subunit TctC
MLVAASSFATNPALTPNLPYDPVKSFSPVILLATGQLAVVVNAGVPAGSLREFIDLVKKNPGKLNYASLGNGSPQHLNMELLKLELGLDVVSVPYKSSASALTDLAGGQVQAIVTSIPSAGPFVNSGKMRFLGVMSASRAPSFPSVPTLAELGHANLEVETWYGVLAPAGTPSGAVTRVNADWNAVLREPEMRGVLGKQGLDAAGGRPEQFSELIKRELPRWQRVVSAAGIKPD